MQRGPTSPSSGLQTYAAPLPKLGIKLFSKLGCVCSKLRDFKDVIGVPSEQTFISASADCLGAPASPGEARHSLGFSHWLPRGKAMSFTAGRRCALLIGTQAGPHPWLCDSWGPSRETAHPAGICWHAETVTGQRCAVFSMVFAIICYVAVESEHTGSFLSDAKAMFVWQRQAPLSEWGFQHIRVVMPQWIVMPPALARKAP